MSSENMEVNPASSSTTPNAEAAKKIRRRQRRVGTVSSVKMQKTIAVEVDRSFAHPLYQRIVRRSSKFLVHDEKNEARLGDRVEIEETRPLSKRKCWRLKRVIARAAE
jgi:small subunit ribosomal protein S17